MDKPSDVVPAEPEPFECLGAPPIVSFSSLSNLLSSAVNASLSRHPAARPAFIGMSLLAHLEGTEMPDAPRRPGGSMAGGSGLSGEMDALSNLLSEALNKARGNDGGGRETILRLAARLIEQHDEDRRSRGKRYTDPKAIWDSIEAGDVILIRASWLLERAGFVEVGRDGGLCSDSNWCWCSRSEPKPLPRRQDIERDHPEAILPLAELREMHRAFQRVAKESTSTASGSGVAGEEPSAFDEGAEALPIVTCSHCWESIDHPDPEGRTLRILAAELADGAWDAFDQRGFPIGTPTAGLPLYRLWGFEDVGVYVDFCSLYQAPRTPDEDACFKRAFAAQDIYFAHSQVTSYLLRNQAAAHLSVARELRGWPFYEEAIAILLKSAAKGTYEVGHHPSVKSLRDHDLFASLWGKVVVVNREDGGPIWSGKPIARTHKSLSGEIALLQMGLDEASAKAEEEARAAETSIDLSRRDRAAAARERRLREERRREAAVQLAERELSAAIRTEAARVVKSARAKPPLLSPTTFARQLKDKRFADGTDCGHISGLYRAVLEDGFGGLRSLHLAGCGWGDAEVAQFARTLREVRISELEVLDLSDNEQWADGEALAEAFETFRGGGAVAAAAADGGAAVGSLMARASSLSSLFTRVPLRQLTRLSLQRCTSLRSLPLSLGRLRSLTSLDLTCCESLLTLPDSIGDLAALETLLLIDCFSLGSLPPTFAKLGALRHLNLDYCDALVSLPDLSSLPKLHVELLPERLAMWEKAGRKAYDFMELGPQLATTTEVDLSFLGTATLPRWLPSLREVRKLDLRGCEALTDLSGISELRALVWLRLSGCRSLRTLEDARLHELADLAHLDLSECEGLAAHPHTMPDLSSARRRQCAVIGLPPRLTPWEDGGRKAWAYDPTAEPPPAPSPCREDTSTVVQSESSSAFATGVAAKVEEEQDGERAAAASAVEKEKDDDEEEQAMVANQHLDISCLDWEDLDVRKAVVALEQGRTINGMPVDARHVIAVDLSDNHFGTESLVELLGMVPQLQSLEIRRCSRLLALPDRLDALVPRLKRLDMEGCQGVKQLPDAICRLVELEELTLGAAFVGPFPDGLGALSKLRSLHCDNLSRVRLTPLPSTWSGLVSLTSLVAKNVPSLHELPEEAFFSTTKLAELDLGCPPMYGDAVQHGCPPPTTLSASIGRLSSLTSLDLSYKGLAVLPATLCDLLELRSLTLRECKRLTTLPADMGQLNLLEQLELGGCCALRELPESCAALHGLVELDLSDWGGGFPACIGRLPRLKRLNISRTAGLPWGKKGKFPEDDDAEGEGAFDMVDLSDAPLPPALEALTLNGRSQLRRLPDALSDLIHLQDLGIVHCGRLESMPDVSRLGALTGIDIRGCDSLAALPPGLGRLVGCMVVMDELDEDGYVKENCGPRRLTVGANGRLCV